MGLKEKKGRRSEIDERRPQNRRLIIRKWVKIHIQDLVFKDVKL